MELDIIRYLAQLHLELYSYRRSLPIVQTGSGSSWARSARLRREGSLPYSSGKRRRFAKTKLGVECCVDQLRFSGEKLEKLDCCRIEENGSVSTVQHRPSEVEDMSEIAEFLTPSEA